jgi:16S rRNA C967 or C1407 C5-methylase (RsmB/RsmF family)/NOL1/NOP2/fmu family ribosome biogenesis protein
LSLLSLPPELLSSLEQIKGFNKESFEQVHASGEQITSIRLNPAKAKSELPDEDDLSTLHDVSRFTAHEKIPWSSYGYYLSTRPSFTLDPLFHAGLYYVQEASSMFLEEVLRQTTDLSKPLKILDLCAAPGGKSTLIQSLISNDSILVSNEVIKSRVGVLQENIIKWGASNVVITNNDPRDFSRMENYFDIIVIDAPCSGSGLFRRDPSAIAEWSEENVKLCGMRQQRILADVWPALKEKGILIYSTCSYSKEENENNIDWIMDEFSADSLQLSLNVSKTDNIPNIWPIIEVISDKHRGYGYRFYPDQIKGEGFFIACLQKKDGAGFIYPRSKKTSLEKLNKNEQQVLGKYIRDSMTVDYFKYNEMVYALPAGLFEDVNYIRNTLYLRKAGVLAGKFAGDELIPDHELALSTMITPGIPAIALSRENAIQFLRKEEIRIDTSEKGWALAQFEKQNLGWMKILQNRINNYYPKEWRIRK